MKPDTLAEMIQGHINVWERLLIKARENSPLPTEDQDDYNYYQHELDALQDIRREIKKELSKQ